ncbi:MAG TPA: response regulator [Polyangiaceae bacterium]|nr:response regulator [Polyangiaceae bacterium]
MNTTFRAKLLVIFGVAILTLVSVMLLSAVITLRQNAELLHVQSRMVPKAELGARVEAEFERLTRTMQDAVAAQDLSALDGAAERKTALFELIAKAGPVLEPATAASLRWAVQDYFETTRDVSRRLIAGESSEALTADVTRMQGQQTKVVALIKRSTSLQRDELAHAFDSIRETNLSNMRLRSMVAGSGIVLVALLAFWGSAGVLQTLTNLTGGLARFGKGEFQSPIPITTRDELAAVAREANQMATNLQRLSEEREREDWLKASLVKLSEELRGDLEPQVVAERALSLLAERVGALVGAFYVREDDGAYHLRASYAGSGDVRELAAVPRIVDGQGLVGQAVASDELTTVDELPGDYMRIRSALGDMPPKQLLIVPLVHFGRKAGVVELGLLEPVSQTKKQMLLAIRATLVIALEASLSSAARKSLLSETQAQAERLTAQEEELRLNNQELLAQQEELRLANTELEQQRMELGRQNQQLERARTVLQEKADELNRVSSYKSQFLANMSHELRTPLNSMLLLSQLLSENDGGNLSTKQVEHLRTIHGAGQDLLGLINEVLDLSKIEAGKQDVVLESVEVQHFAGFVRRLFEVTAAQRGIALITDVDASAPQKLVTDRQRVERILTNLISNALKFTERGQVALRIGRPSRVVADLATSEALAFAVSDTGIGIPESARERVFAPFEQVQGETNRGHAGTGLGLSIARESARLLGGELLLEDSSPGGSTFVCIVPQRAELAQVPLTSRAPSAKRVEDDLGGLSPDEPHLLVIEDDDVLAEQLVDIAHARGLKVVVMSTGEAGLKVAAHGKSLGIILDVKLPDLDGWTVMERLKRDPATRGVPVHFVSGVDAPQRGLALGAVGYLVKPASHSELATMIRTLVPTKQAAQGVLIVEDDADQAESVMAVLQRDGFLVKHASTGSAALDALGTAQFGCMILDLGLPDMDGLGLLKTLRQRPELPTPRVVIHTGRALSKQETRDLEAYAEVVVLKQGGSAERLLEEIRLFVRHVRDRAAVAPQPEPTRVDVSLRGIKLLLAEDDMRTVYSLSALLRSKGADVVTAETGKEALAALSAHPDIRGVLMDVMMPEMDGYEAMRQLRRDERFAALPVIALTAKAMKGERERCLDAGASEYLPKPIDGDKLLTTLHSFLQPRPADA